MPWEIIITSAVLGTLWLVTALAQIPRPLAERILSWDRFGMIPSWRLFAPQPVASDVTLCYRDRRVDGSFSEWWVLLGSRGRQPGDWLWNPAERSRLMLQGIAREFEGLLEDNEPALLTLSGVYVAVLARVVEEPRSEGAAARQFLLYRSFGTRSARGSEPVFLSAFHGLDSGSAGAP